MKVSATRPWWRPSTRCNAAASLDGETVLAADDWLAAQVTELESRSLGERAPITVVKLHLEDHGRGTPDELRDAEGWLQTGLPAYSRLFRESERDFVLLAPGADTRRARALCRKLLDHVESRSLWRGGWIYLRCGACASVEGEPFDFESISAMAEEALAEADTHGGVAVVESVSRGHLRVVGAEG